MAVRLRMATPARALALSALAAMAPQLGSALALAARAREAQIARLVQALSEGPASGACDSLHERLATLVAEAILDALPR